MVDREALAAIRERVAKAPKFKHAGGGQLGIDYGDGWGYVPAGTRGAEFVAHAREDIPALLGLLDEVRPWVAELVELYEDHAARLWGDRGNEVDWYCHSCGDAWPCATSVRRDAASAFLAAIREGSQQP